MFETVKNRKKKHFFLQPRLKQLKAQNVLFMAKRQRRHFFCYFCHQATFYVIYVNRQNMFYTQKWKDLRESQAKHYSIIYWGSNERPLLMNILDPLVPIYLHNYV